MDDLLVAIVHIELGLMIAPVGSVVIAPTTVVVVAYVVPLFQAECGWVDKLEHMAVKINIIAILGVAITQVYKRTGIGKRHWLPVEIHSVTVNLVGLCEARHAPSYKSHHHQ